jgi:hypothetical protein
MKVAELRTILEEVQAIYEASGSDKPAKDFADFIELLGGYEHQTVDEFLAALSALLSTASSKGTYGRAPGPTKPNSTPCTWSSAPRSGSALRK